jgi:Cu(I)/Ag(I) efflux system membrane fusion protein
MKRYNGKILILLLVILPLLGGVSCRAQKVPPDVAYYTCPMHPQIKMDQPGNCPICGMDLIPVKKEEVSSSDHDGSMAAEKEPTNQGMVVKIDPARVQQIGVQTEAAQVRDLKKYMLVQGKVAHDPKLWVAQKEYLIASDLGDPALIRAAEEKLLLLGLSRDWIGLLKKYRKSDLGLFLPEQGRPTFFEAFLNQSDLGVVQPGQTVVITDMDGRVLGKGVIRALGTILDMESRTLRALIEADTFLDLKSNSFVQLKIEMDLGERLSVAKSAILFNGDHNMVYVETGPGKFVGRKIELGEAAGDFYEIKAGLQAGEKVVINGHFLIDSETQMRMGGTSGHQH